MGTTTPLIHLLRSLCHNSPWKYAVFWKLEIENRMLLMWEDGFFDHTKSCVTFENDSFLSSRCGLLSFDGETNSQNGNFAKCQIEMAVKSMASYPYLLGERKIGEAAFERKNQWIFASKMRSQLPPEYHEEWEPQFQAGIKTILLVPVDTIGVLQLGSMTTVMEDDPLVMNHISTLLNSHLHISGPSFTVEPVMDFVCSFTDVITPIRQNLCTWPDLTDAELPHISFEEIAETEEGLYDKYSARKNATVKTDVLKNAVEDDSDITSQAQSFCRSSSEPSIKTAESFCKKCPDDGCYDLSHLEEEIDEQLTDNANLMNVTGDFELIKAIAGFLESDDSDWSAILSNISGTVAENDFYRGELPDISRPIIEECDRLYMSDVTANLFIDEILADWNYCSNDDNSIATQSIEPSTSPSDLVSGSCVTQSKSEADTKHLDNHIERSREKPSSGFGRLKNSAIMPLSDDPKVFMDKEEKKIMDCIAHNQKRGRNSNSHKPRPRDRQLIQDRVKELRDIIPDGSKCSIDALLDKTIKHMQFLQNVSDLADKLKHCTNIEFEGTDGTQTKERTCQTGTSRVYEYGSHSEACPLVIQNLADPGHILVEMLCKDYSLFLEIAQVMRQMELRILKGVLENRSDQLWAHFIIEVSSSFHRMNILWPMMHLLQRNYKITPT